MHFNHISSFLKLMASQRKEKACLNIASDVVRQSLYLAYASYGKGFEKLQNYPFLDLVYLHKGEIYNVQKQNVIAKTVNSLKHVFSTKHLPFKKETSPNDLNALFATYKEGKHSVLIIAIAGTTKSMSDWKINMDMTHVEGLHHGFLSNTQKLMHFFDDVQLPNLAHALGTKPFNVSEFLHKAKAEHSPFSLWLTGHSKGGALIQVLASDLLNRGLHNFFGFGFASPCVANSQCPYAKSSVPLVHILNANDVVPSLGSNYRLGHSVVYGGAWGNYFPPKVNPDDACIKAFLSFFPIINTCQKSLCFSYAMLMYLSKRGIENDVRYVQLFYKEGANGVIQTVLEKIKSLSQDIDQKPLNMAWVESYTKLIEQALDAFPLTQVVKAYFLAFQAPHTLYKENMLSPYANIVQNLTQKHSQFTFGQTKKREDKSISFQHLPTIRTAKIKTRAVQKSGKLSNPKTQQ